MVELIIVCVGSGFVGAIFGGAGAALYVTRNYERPRHLDSGE